MKIKNIFQFFSLFTRELFTAYKDSFIDFKLGTILHANNLTPSFVDKFVDVESA